MASVEGPRVVLVEKGDVEVPLWSLDGLRTDLPLVDRLATLCLAARRHGLSIRLVDAGDELRALLDLVGLAGLLLEADGEPEVGEAVGVEEVVDAGDPPL